MKERLTNMPYIYEDEDNQAMTDDRWEEERAEAKERAYQKTRNHIEGLADMLELTGDCRKCHYFTELAEGFLDQNGLIANEQFDYLKMQCFVCCGMGTGKPLNDKHREWIEKDWLDRLEWARDNLPRYSCAWCPVAFRIYGQYKDPDDEWKAIDSADGCANCKYFQEVD